MSDIGGMGEMDGGGAYGWGQGWQIWMGVKVADMNGD